MSSGQESEEDRLTVRTRWQALTRTARVTKLRVALLASFTVDPLVPYLGIALEERSLPAELWAGPYNQIERQCLDSDSATACFGPDVLVVAPRFEELWGGLPIPLDDPPARYQEDLLYLAETCIDAAWRWRAELLFVLPALPQVRLTGVGDDGNPTGVSATAAQAREMLRARLASRTSVAVVDAEEVLRTIGGRGAYRPSLMAVARIPFSEEYFDLLGQRVARLVARRRRSVRVIVLDRVLPDEDLERFLGQAHRLGVSVAVVDADAKLRAQLTASLPLAAWREPGEAVAGQVQAIAEELRAENVDVAFLSTRAEAVAAVAERLPSAALLLLPPEPETWVRALDECGILDLALPQRAVACDEVAAPTLDDFRRRLGLRVSCEPLPPESRDAAADLTRRVAEFHLNGSVWEAERFAEVAAGDVCWGVRARDRFGDHGLCGLVVAHAAGPCLAVDLWVLTCPVLGKGIEDVTLRKLADEARARGCSTIGFAYGRTERNTAIKEFLATIAPSADLGLPLVLVPVHGIQPPAPGAPAEPAARRVPVAVPAAGPAPRQAPSARPSRRALTAASATGDFTSASQILAAMESRVPDRATRERTGRAGQAQTGVERLLAEVFATVLRLPSVSVDDDFFSQGGSSMRAVGLITKANQAGLRITLQQVFQHRTIAGLAPVATLIAHREDTVAEVGPTPLLPGPAWLLGLGLPNPGHFNQSLRFEVRDDVDPAVLRRAVAWLVDRHQALRVRFENGLEGLRQADRGSPEPPFTHLDMSGTPAADQDQAIASEEFRLQREMSPADGRLVRIALFTFGADRPPMLLVIFHRLAIDRISWTIVLDDLQEAYRAAAQGQAEAPGPASVGVLAWAKRIHGYAQSEGVRAELQQWTIPARRRVEQLPADLPGGNARGAFTDRMIEVLSGETTSKLRERAIRADRVTVDVLLLTAVTRTLAEWAGRDRLLIDVVNHGRDLVVNGIDVSRTVGWLNMHVPVLFELDGVREPAALVPMVDEQLRRWSSHHGMGDNLLRHLSGDAKVRAALAELPVADVLFSYGGRYAPEPGNESLLRRLIEGHGDDMDPLATTPYALQIETIKVDDRLRLEIYYRGARYRRETIRSLLDGCLSVLDQLVDRAGGESRGQAAKVGGDSSP